MKKLLKPYFLIPLIILIFVVMLFVIWQIIPNKTLDVAILDKTVPATSEQSESTKRTTKKYYRKHEGFFWILNNQKYVKSSDKKKYDKETDYFGPKIDESGNILSNDELSNIDFVPDFMYVADVYGSELYDNEYCGLSSDDMSVVSLAHSTGATVVAEMDLFNSTKDDSVNTEVKNMCGITTTGWSGRYVTDLSDLSDVPEWAPPDYQAQYGVEWRFSGPGIILVNVDGTIIVLEEKTDFNSRSLLTIEIDENYKDEFKHCSKANFYNWFELIKPNSSTESIANYSFDLNATGMEKIKDISSTPVFTAITRCKNNDEAPVYYFAGDFNDYVQKSRSYYFLFADYFHKALSFNKDGDVTHFYWRFYNPLMKQILKDCYNNKSADKNAESDNSKVNAVSRIEDNKLQVLADDDKWVDFSIKGFNINAYEPGEDTYSRKYSFYKSLLDEVAEIGGNCVRVKDILPPEFYRALSDFNKSAENKIYLIQSVPIKNDDETVATNDGLKNAQTAISNAIKVANGKVEIQVDDENKTTYKYMHNVSNYVIGYILDVGLTSNQAEALNKSFSKSFDSTYISTSGSGLNSYYATLTDYAYNQLNEINSYLVPVGIKGNVGLISTAFWNKNSQPRCYNFNNINVKDSAKAYFFTSYSLSNDDSVLKTYNDKFKTYSDNNGTFAYGGYLKYVKALEKNHPMLIDSLGVSTNSKTYSDSEAVVVADENKQGNEIVRMMNCVSANGCLGGLISDLNDNWNAYSKYSYPYIVSIKNNKMWHDLTDPAQTTGIVAMQAKEPDSVGLELSDFEVMKKTQLSVNPEYLYITVMLEKEIDFKTNKLFLGLDTYQRNDGEYLFDKSLYGNSLSGMEYLIKINDEKTASLYVAKSYNRGKAKYSSKENYNGEWEFVTNLQYGNFTTTTSQFYVASTNIKIRIPWSLLNFTDPSQKLIINQKAGALNNQISTTSTNGFIYYMYLGNMQSKDTDYMFPISKQATGYKIYKYSQWENVEYELKRKASFTILKAYFKSF